MLGRCSWGASSKLALDDVTCSRSAPSWPLVVLAAAAVEAAAPLLPDCIYAAVLSLFCSERKNKKGMSEQNKKKNN